MRTLHPLLGYLTCLWAIGGCSPASATDSSAPTTRGALAEKRRSNPVPSSRPLEAPTPHKSPERPPGPPPSDSNQTLTDTALERKLDQLEREIRGS